MSDGESELSRSVSSVCRDVLREKSVSPIVSYKLSEPRKSVVTSTGYWSDETSISSQSTYHPEDDLTSVLSGPTIERDDDFTMETDSNVLSPSAPALSPTETVPKSRSSSPKLRKPKNLATSSGETVPTSVDATQECSRERGSPEWEASSGYALTSCLLPKDLIPQGDDYTHFELPEDLLNSKI